MSKPNCYECRHRQDAPGSAHSSCKHPAYDGAMSAVALVQSLLPARNRSGPIEAPAGSISVKGSPHGIANGWFMHPLNFDPTWLEECNGFESKQSTAVSGAVSQAA